MATTAPSSRGTHRSTAAMVLVMLRSAATAASVGSLM
ncbi:Uncharacterised protein [Mycobacteroides abscessus subsp. abscessus]|nr:Uncharacterised protein [Mycobacteroides abscessus subsp. abscessus]